MNVAYVDRPTLRSLLAVARGGRPSELFDLGEGPSTWAARTAVAVGLSPSPETHDYYLRDVRDESGALQAFRISEDSCTLSQEVVDEEILGSLFFRTLAAVFESEALAQFFEKVVDIELHRSLVLVNVVASHARATGAGSAVLALERTPWSARVAAYAADLGVEVRVYRPLTSVAVRRHAGRLLRSPRRAVPSGPPAQRPAQEGRPRPPAAAETGAPSPASRPSGAAIATWHTGRRVTFERAMRSDVFWMLDAEGIRREDVLVYFDRADVTAARDALAALAGEGVSAVALSAAAAGGSGMAVWSPGERYRAERRAGVRALVGAAAASLARGRWVTAFVLANAYHFVERYAYWADFFGSHRVKVSVSPYDFTKPYMAKNLALRRCGGVSVSYQWSNMSFVACGLSNSSDALFAFGPAYRPVFEGHRTRAGRTLYSGYVTDHAFAAARPAAEALRARLDAAGARTVLAFLDENSSDSRMSIITNEATTAVYRVFLQRVLDDPAFGLVVKPGYPRTLSERIAPVWGLAQEAVATGRCVFLDEGAHVTDRYPTEAAQAADACVGLLMSGTAALETWLSGTPTVFLDDEGLLDHEVRAWGQDAVVFDSPEAILDAFDRWRAEPASLPGFGDLSRWAEGRDTFRDGRAAERMGAYIGWLHEALASGAGRDEALERADRLYAEAWGEGAVVTWR